MNMITLLHASFRDLFFLSVIYDDITTLYHPPILLLIAMVWCYTIFLPFYYPLCLTAVAFLAILMCKYSHVSILSCVNTLAQFPPFLPPFLPPTPESISSFSPTIIPPLSKQTTDTQGAPARQ